jgi:hypothetical protein
MMHKVMLEIAIFQVNSVQLYSILRPKDEIVGIDGNKY